MYPAKPKILVSMTSYPGRITNVYKSIGLLLTNQTQQPDEIHLWLVQLTKKFVLKSAHSAILSTLVKLRVLKRAEESKDLTKNSTDSNYKGPKNFGPFII